MGRIYEIRGQISQSALKLTRFGDNRGVPSEGGFGGASEQKTYIQKTVSGAIQAVYHGHDRRTLKRGAEGSEHRYKQRCGGAARKSAGPFVRILERAPGVIRMPRLLLSLRGSSLT